MDKLQLKGLTKKFGNLTVVDNLNLSLRSGEFVSLLGPSGCGKTTTLRMIAGFIAPTAGTVEMDGKQMSSASASLPPSRPPSFSPLAPISATLRRCRNRAR